MKRLYINNKEEQEDYFCVYDDGNFLENHISIEILIKEVK